MIFIITLFILFALMFAIPFAGDHIGWALYKKYDNLESAAKDKTEEAKNRTISEMWYHVYDAFSEDIANVFMYIGATMAIVVILIYAILLPISLDEQNRWVAEYQVYEKSYNDWKNGLIDEPSYSNYSLIYLQQKINAKRRFREQHPFFSCYVGHELDDLDALKFVYDK